MRTSPSNSLVGRCAAALLAVGLATSVAAAPVIVAPPTADPGQEVPVRIVDAADGARVELWGPIDQGGQGELLEVATIEAGGARLLAPAEPGSYVLALIGPGGGRSATAAFEVAVAPVTLRAPNHTGVGSETEVRWRGPAHPGDRLQFVDPASGTVLSEAPVMGRSGGEAVTFIVAPQQPGEFELRYYSDTQGKALNKLPVTVTSLGAGRRQTLPD